MVFKDGFKNDGTAFLAFFLPNEAREAYDHIEDLNTDLHMTILYIPDGIDTPDDRKAVLESVREVCKRTKPIECQCTEIGIMGDEENTLVTNVNCLGGDEFYVDLLETIEKKLGREIDRKYGFLPHVSLRYENETPTAERKQLRKFKWTADALSVQFGRKDRKRKYDLSGTKV